jgi:hypothetical protein
MRTPDILEHCVHIYTSHNQQIHLRDSRALAVTTNDQPNPESDGVDQDNSFLYPLNPMNTIQYFDNGVDGFGPWKILLSTKCEGDLRKSRRADSNRFAIIEKKIKYTFYSSKLPIWC